MKINILDTPVKKAQLFQIYVVDSEKQAEKLLHKDEIKYCNEQFKKNETGKPLVFNKGKQQIVIIKSAANKNYKDIEKNRRSGAQAANIIKAEKAFDSFNITQLNNDNETFLAFVEGFALAAYQFNKYKTDKDKLTILNISITTKAKKSEIKTLANLLEATYAARDLVNEPPDFLTSVQLAKEIEKLGKTAGFKVEVFNKKKIEALKMGGLLAVNRGSVVPPTFSVLEWKPEKAQNKQPIILVGKGVVYDTGGLNIKVGAGMEDMKCDMGGSAAVIGALYAVAKNKLPLHVVGLVPSTDNRLNGMAYAAGDVITMHSGKTVEVLNTDAEGRMLLADALSYAQKYKPEIVLDAATLTGAAARAIGQWGVVAMGTAGEKYMKRLKKSGNEVYERIAEFPFWEEYDDLLKSNVGDIKNIGGAVAGAITAGKFLWHFTNYPWIHLDIAGPAFLHSDDTYKPQGGTGVGVRLFYQFIKNYEK